MVIQIEMEEGDYLLLETYEGDGDCRHFKVIKSKIIELDSDMKELMRGV